MTRLRCAIYTRKSSEEGLEQAFNSLDAQREACEAFVQSQKGEGWTALPDRYDDGGLSGANMSRPALQRLLTHIRAGLVDLVLVYKVDRLTRSLADFAKMIEVFDSRRVAFVSVTQAFNTTTSMGRLTLNVLLSFAQFERELTSERIRDKIAASKARGMWMGGTIPLGYRAEDRKLIIDPVDAELVRHIFKLFLACKSVAKLQTALEVSGIRSKQTVSRRGNAHGGVVYSRGALLHMLRNRVYLGEIVHKGTAYTGDHEALMETSLFEDVQKVLNSNRRARIKRARRGFPLAGLLFDANGHRLTTITAYRGNGTRVYRYYVPVVRTGSAGPASKGMRVSAILLETLVLDQLRLISGRQKWGWAELQPFLRQVRIKPKQVMLEIDAPEPERWLSRARQLHRAEIGSDGCLHVSFHAHLRPRGGSTSVRDAAPHAQQVNFDFGAITALKRAHWELQSRNIEVGSTKLHATSEIPARSFEQVALAFLAPDIQRSIPEGRQPARCNLKRLVAQGVPTSWAAQRELLGFRAHDRVGF